MTAITSTDFNQNISNYFHDIDKAKEEFNSINSTKDIIASLDKLWIRSNNINLKWIEKNSTSNQFIPSKYYKKGSVYKYKTKKGKKVDIIVMLNKRRMKKDAPDFDHKIEVTPYDIGDKKELEKVLTKILGSKGLQNHKVTRVDISFRIPNDLLSVRSLHLTTTVMNKQYSKLISDIGQEYFSGELASYMVGKTPHRLSIYNQEKKKKKAEPYTNFEILFGEEKLKKLFGIETLSDLSVLTKKMHRRPTRWN